MKKANLTEIKLRFKDILIKKFNIEAKMSSSSTNELDNFTNYMLENGLVSEVISKRYVVLQEIRRLLSEGMKVTPIMEKLSIELGISEKHLWNIWKDYK
jgi:hypothetical protein